MDVDRLHIRWLCGWILRKTFLDFLFYARLGWTLNSACVISIIKHLDMAAFDNRIPARLTENVRWLFLLTKGAYQLAFLHELHCVDNTVLHFIHAMIVSTLIGTSLCSSHNCLSSNFYHPSELWRFPSCDWHSKLCSKITRFFLLEVFRLPDTLRHPNVVDRSFSVSRDYCNLNHHRQRVGRSSPNEQKVLL